MQQNSGGGGKSRGGGSSSNNEGEKKNKLIQIGLRKICKATDKGIGEVNRLLSASQAISATTVFMNGTLAYVLWCYMSRASPLFLSTPVVPLFVLCSLTL